MNKKEQSRQTFDLQASKYDTTFYGNMPVKFIHIF